jgi:hypothetical protein
MFRLLLTGALAAGTALLWLTQAQAQSIQAAPDQAVQTSFDIIETKITTKGNTAIFSTRVRGEAGKDKPDVTGKFEGSSVYAYVWPTSLDSSEIGFDKKQGIVALAVTFHPDFDDAANGGTNRHVWHPHWVVLPKDTKPKVPKTWPGVPLLIDSPEYPTAFKGDKVDVEIPLSLIGGIKGASFDGVTAGLKVNGNLHAPLLCVSNVFKVASGNLSLPGKVEQAK